LFERAVGFLPIVRAARRAGRGKPLSDAAASFLFDLEPEALRLESELDAGTYRPGPYRTFLITDPKRRLISAAPFRDRVVHHAVCAVLEPVLERYAVHDSYACRKGKGTLAALDRAQILSTRSSWFLKLDIRHLFETMNHSILKDALRRRIKDARFLELLFRIIDAGAPGSPAGVGLPIGNLTSQHFANFFLGAVDHFVLERVGVEGYCRYMDDFLIFGSGPDVLRRQHDVIEAFLGSDMDLILNSRVTRLDRVSSGVPFLGFRIWPETIRMDRVRVRRFRRKISGLEQKLREGGMDEAAASRSAASLIGWTMHGNTSSFRRSFFDRRGEDGEGTVQAPTG